MNSKRNTPPASAAIAVVLAFFASARLFAQGDTCATATPISALPFVATGTTCGATDDYHETCPFLPSGASDVVYSYTPTSNQIITVDLCDSSFDTRVYIFAGPCPAVPASGQAIACNDDACGVDGWRSRIDAVPLTAGTVYSIVIDGFGSDCGTFQLAVSGWSPILGDRCDDPWEIASLPFTDAQDTCGLQDDYHETCPFLPGGGPDGVYRFLPTRDLFVRIDLCPSDYDTRVYVFAGSCPTGPLSGAAISCNDDACGVNGWRSRLDSVPLTAGIEVFIVVDGYGTGCGAFEIEIEEVLPPGPGEWCGDPIEVGALPFAATITTSGPSRHEHECQFIFAGAPERVLRYLAIEDEVISVSACSADFDPKLTVATGACPLPTDLSPVAIACADDSCGLDGLGARIAAVRLSAGETAWIVVDGHAAGEEGAVLVEIERVCAPDHPTALVSMIDVPETPIGLAMSAAGDRLYVASRVANTVSVIDTITDTVIDSVLVGASPYRLVLTPDGTRLYVCEYFGGTIRCLDPFTLALIDLIPFSGRPLGLAISPDGSTLWGVDEIGGILRAWSIPGHSVIATFSGLGAPREVLVHPDGSSVFITDFYGQRVLKLALGTPPVLTSVFVDETPQSLVIAPDGQHLLVGNFGWDRSPDTIPVLRIADLALVARLRIGSGLEEMVFVPGTNRLITTYWGYTYLPSSSGEEVGHGLGSIQVLRIPTDFTAIGDPLAPPLLDVSEALIPLLGDYIFGLAVLPDGSRAYASATGATGASPTEDHIAVIGFPNGFASGRFRRGDANLDGATDIADPIRVLDVLFGGAVSACDRALDANDDENVDISDAITLLSAIFQGLAPLPPPTICSIDPTPGGLCCDVEGCP
ncbi:MAG: hypothetical protein ACKVX7_18125 [Planctomycetota bacterium]